MTGLLPKKRIEAIDALRGYALMCILLMHCMEHFELYIYPETTSPILAWFDTTLSGLWKTIISGKAIAIFSLLFGLSFFIQMKNQEERGIDFRGRFIWRLVLLYIFGYINGLMYLGEIFAVYAVLGLLLVPLYKVPDRWIKWLCVITLFHLPFLIWAVAMLVDPSIQSAPLSGMMEKLMASYSESIATYRDGTFAEAISFNLWDGHMQKWMWMLWSPRLLQILGLFLLGMLLGRKGVHRDEGKMVRYAKKALGWGLLLVVLFYAAKNLLPMGGWGEAATEFAQRMAGFYMDIGIMFMIVGIFILAYFRLDAKRVLDNLAPFGRMSVTNYITQSLIGAFIFYGYGLGLGAKLGQTWSILIGVAFVVMQVLWSKWWMKRYYYGPMEWLWRSLTWGSFRNVPFRKNEEIEK